MNRLMTVLRGCRTARRVGTSLLSLALATMCAAGVSIAQEPNPDPSLLGVSRSFIEANGYPANAITSPRGFNQQGSEQAFKQIPRSGFDIINDGTVGTVLVRGVRQVPNGTCDGLSDDAFFLVHVAGRPGDADGDGNFKGNSGSCAAKFADIGSNRAINDGGSGDVGILTFDESVKLAFDRNCDGAQDLIFRLTQTPGSPTQLEVVTNLYSGSAPNTFLGGQGVAWEAATFPGTAYDQCPDPATFNGYYILRIPNFSSYFTTPGHNPGDFGWEVTAGAVDDGLAEDQMAGKVLRSEPALGITKGPDLSLCPNAEGNYTIVVTNNGNAIVRNIVISDQLPAGATLVNVVSGGLTPSGNTGLITFSPFDLAQCESKELVIRVRANADCQGNDINSASAAGDYSTFCDVVTPGLLETKLISAGPATANFICLVRPCVSIVLNALPPQCPGTAVTVSGTATNCANGPSRLFVQLGNGTEVDLGVVQPSASVPFNLPAGNISCPGGSTYTVNARGEGSEQCPGTTDTETVSITCKPVPCVSIVLNALAPQCPGTAVTVTGTATNCGAAVANLFVRLGDGTEVDLGAVQPTASVAFNLPAGNINCPGGSTYTVNARADVPGDVDCPGTGDTETVSITCLTPSIEVTKTGPTSVANGATISYEIRVSNPSTTTDLEFVTVIDELCTYVRDPRNFGGTCPTGAPQINGRTITWPEFSLARNSSCTITFDVTADVTVGGAACPTTVQCQNNVRVFGFCQGSARASRVDADGSWMTQITCAGEACPRTVGFWGAQCAQRGNGSTKFTRDQVTQIASCIDDRSAFFNWAAGTDFDMFCRTLSTSNMTQRVQAKRQFAGVLANMCTDALNLQPSQGGKIFLDPSTTVSCSGLTSTTLGALVDEVDAILAELEGQSLNDPVVKNRYGQLISCLDAINNGTNISVRSDCEHGGTTTPTGDAEQVGDGASVDTGVSVELYRPYPNPFTGATSFAYKVDGSDAPVDITVYDVSGRQIRKLVSGVQAAGQYTASWDGQNEQGMRVNRGVYFVRTVIAGRKEATNRILYLTEGR